MTFHDGRALAPPLLDEFFAFSARFVDADRSYLARQFARHAYVVVFRSGGRLVGTVSVDIYPLEHEGRALTVLFTSGTILDDGRCKGGPTGCAAVCCGSYGVFSVKFLTQCLSGWSIQ